MRYPWGYRNDINSLSPWPPGECSQPTWQRLSSPDLGIGRGTDKGGRGTSEWTVCKRGSTASRLHKERLPLPGCGDGTKEGGPFLCDRSFFSSANYRGSHMVVLSWVGPSLARDPTCLTSVVTTVFSFSGEAPGQQAYYSISEPTWITKLTEKQKGSQVPVPTKEPEAKNRATIKEASSVVRCAAAHGTLPQGARTG